MKINLKWTLYLPLIFLFLPAFVFWVPFLKTTCNFFYISIYMCLGVLFFISPRSFINNFLKLYKLKYFRYLIWLISVIIINSIFLSFIKIGLISHSLKAIISQILLLVLPVLLYFSYILDKYISLEDFFKFYTTLLWIFFLIGFVSYIGSYFNIQFLLSIFEFLANDRFIYTQNIGMNMQTSNYFSYGLPRLSCLFDEPGHYAQFVFLNLPLIFCVASSNLKINNVKYLSYLIKKTLVPFALFSIILTMSPIFLVFTILFCVIFYFDSIKQHFYKTVPYLCILLFIITIILSYTNLENTYLYRIIKVMSSIKSYDDFNIVEPSLATRVGTYINSICVFFQYPLTGVGYGNLAHKLIWQYAHSPVPLTPEVIYKSNLLSVAKNIAFCGKGLYTFIAENGILICSFTFFYFKSIFNKIKFNVKHININNIWMHNIARILFFEFFVFTICIFYNLSFIARELWLFIALLIIFLNRRNENE